MKKLLDFKKCCLGKEESSLKKKQRQVFINTLERKKKLFGILKRIFFLRH